jgi:N-acetylmuramoyl-L-alanine amidase
LGNASLAILIILLLAAGGFAAYRMGVFSHKQEAEPAAESTAAEEAAEDASVSHAPAASVIAPILSEEESSTSAAAELSQEEQPAPADPVEEPGLAAEDIIVCIDPGLGGKDPGCNTETRLEKDDVLKLGLAMRTAMEAQGIKVIMTREDDTFIPLDERCEIANKANATYFISVHRNIFGSDDVYGDEIWKSSNASEEASALADNVMSGLEGVGMQRNRGVREGSQDGNGDYAVLRNTKMCSILLEMGFMQNKKDNKYFDKNVDAYAEAVTQAVLDTWEEFHVDLDDVANLD